MAFTMLPIDFIYEHIEDEHGVYETGMFTYKWVNGICPYPPITRSDITN